MKNLLLAFGCLLLPVLNNDLSAQLISQFTWDNSTDPSVADVGPNAVSINEFATVKLRTDGNTNGLAPGAIPNKADLNMILADSSIFNVPGIDLSVDYQSDENSYQLIRRGNFRMGESGFNVTYRVTEANGTCSDPIVSPDFTIERVDTLRNYRFRYEAASGIGQLFIDDGVVWTSTPTPHQPLCWSGAGNITVGSGLDGSGLDKAVFDNLRIEAIPHISPPSDADTILYFDWEQGDPLISAIGPDAISVGAGITTRTRLDGNTLGIAAPITPATGEDSNLDLVIAEDPLFDVEGIDLSVDYQRDEGTYTIFSRNNFVFCQNGINVTYRVTEPDGSCSAPISSTPATAAEDDTYRNYRFRYEPNTGVATLSVDDDLLWVNAGAATPGQALCWTGDGDLVIGTELDGSDTGNTILDNLRIGGIALSSSLPVELVSFTAEPKREAVWLSWRTATESGNDYFELQRLGNSGTWMALGRTRGYGTTHQPQQYQTVDNAPLAGTNYYRLRQVDLDGTATYSQIVEVTMGAALESPVQVFPNPSRDAVNFTGLPDRIDRLGLHDQQGRDLSATVTFRRQSDGTLSVRLGNLEPGIYFLRADDRTVRLVKQ